MDFCSLTALGPDTRWQTSGKVWPRVPTIRKLVSAKMPKGGEGLLWWPLVYQKYQTLVNFKRGQNLTLEFRSSIWAQFKILILAEECLNKKISLILPSQNPKTKSQNLVEFSLLKNLFMGLTSLDSL